MTSAVAHPIEPCQWSLTFNTYVVGLNVSQNLRHTWILIDLITTYITYNSTACDELVSPENPAQLGVVRDTHIRSHLKEIGLWTISMGFEMDTTFYLPVYTCHAPPWGELMSLFFALYDTVICSGSFGSVPPTCAGFLWTDQGLGWQVEIATYLTLPCVTPGSDVAFVAANCCTFSTCHCLGSFPSKLSAANVLISASAGPVNFTCTDDMLLMWGTILHTHEGRAFIIPPSAPWGGKPLWQDIRAQ